MKPYHVTIVVRQIGNAFIASTLAETHRDETADCAARGLGARVFGVAEAKVEIKCVSREFDDSPLCVYHVWVPLEWDWPSLALFAFAAIIGLGALIVLAMTGGRL